MKKEDVYESPLLEIVEIETEQAVLSASFTGEGINEWEEM
jgi:hypothetical protein